MSLYIVVFLFLFFFSVLERVDDEQEISGILVKKNLLYLISVFLILFAGLRYNTGPDYRSYKIIYDTYGHIIDFNSRYEPGFVLMMHFFKNIINASFETFLFFLTALAVILKVLFFKRFFKHPIFFLFLYYPFFFFIVDFGQIRQGVALGFILWCLPAIKERKLLKFLIFWLLACFFHYSALLFFPFYILGNITVKFSLFLFLFFAGFIFNILNLGKGIFSIMALLTKGTLIGSIMEYMIEYGSTEGFNIILYYFFQPSTLFIIILLVIFMYYYRDEIHKKRSDGLEITLYNVTLSLMLIVKFFTTIAAFQRRGSYFYKFFELFFWYYIMERFSRKEEKAIFFLLLLIYGIVRLIVGYNNYPFYFDNYKIYLEFLGF